MNNREFKSGDIVQHFKRLYINNPTTDYLYEIISTNAHHTETDEKLIVYKALYGEHIVCCRPYEMFMSKVDKIKYPDAKQEYRFELYHGD